MLTYQIVHDTEEKRQERVYKEIKKRQMILQGGKPYAKETAEMLRAQTTLHWVWSDFVLDGSLLTKEETERLLQGELLPNASLQEHSRAAFCEEMIHCMGDLLRLEIDLDLKTLNKLYGYYNGTQSAEYRSENPVLPQLNYAPLHFKEIEAEMKKLFYWSFSKEAPDNVLELSAILHNRIAEIYPYGADSFAMARTAAQYTLMRNGLPAVFWDLKEQEYYGLMRPYMEKKDILPMYRFLERSVYNRQEVLLQLMEE